MRLPLFLALSASLALAACKDPQAAKDGEPANKAAQTAAHMAPLAERSADRAALTAAFAVAFDNPAQKVGDDTYTYTPAALYRLADKWVLLSEGTGPDCHACSGWLAVHYLNRAPDGVFTLAKGWNDAVPGTSFGGAPEWTVRTDLMAAPVIESQGGGTWQGYSCSIGRLTELADAGPKVRVERIPLMYNDGGAIVDDARKAEEMEGRIAQGLRDESFTVRYTGTVARDVAYTRKGEAFVPGPGADKIPQC